MRVIYGDTDSMFIHMKGRSLKSAHELGLEIAREITKRHPYPIELKFEKVNAFWNGQPQHQLDLLSRDIVCKEKIHWYEI